MEKELNNVRVPNCKWAQRKDRIYLTIDAVDVKTPQIDIVDGKILKFKGKDKEGIYAFELELYDEVVKEESKFSLDGRNIFLNIKKQTKGPYWPRITKIKQKLNWLQNDWRNYIDEEEEHEGRKPIFPGNEYNFTGPEEEDVEEYIPDIEKEKREQIEEEIKLAKMAGEGNKEETVKQNDEK